MAQRDLYALRNLLASRIASTWQVVPRAVFANAAGVAEGHVCLSVISLSFSSPKEKGEGRVVLERVPVHLKLVNVGQGFTHSICNQRHTAVKAVHDP